MIDTPTHVYQVAERPCLPAPEASLYIAGTLGLHCVWQLRKELDLV